jgi:hypothetical protein
MLFFTAENITGDQEAGNDDITNFFWPQIIPAPKISNERFYKNIADFPNI